MFRKYKQSIKISFLALWSNKTKSFLTMLGIIIGVGAVIVIMSVGAGAQSLILSQVKTLGANKIGVLPGKSEEKSPPPSAIGIVITTLTYEDAISLKNKNKAPNIVNVVAYSKGIATVSYKTKSYDTNLSGCTVGYLDVEGGEVEKGRFFTKDEEKNLSRVVVLGSTVKKELFGKSDAIGKRVKFKKHTFEVIGVMAERGTVAMQDYDDQILLPIKTMQKLVAGVNHLGLIRVKIDDEKNTDKAIRDIKTILRENHNIKDNTGYNDDFTVRSAAQALDMLEVITDALRYFLAAMASMSLIVGGIGIMNIMLVSVSERTREIGLRKAIGAKINDILLQFLFEASTITFVGGIIGIILGIFISWLISIVANYLNYDWAFIISPLAIVLAVSISIIIGLIFGLYPAKKASKLEPVEALRYE